MNERDKINYAKSELRNYKFLAKALKGAENRVEEIIAAIENYKPSPIVIEGEGSSGPKSYRNAELHDRLERRQQEYDVIKFRVDKIEQFLDGLDDEEREIVVDVYVDGMTIGDVASNNNYSEIGMKKKIDRILLNF